MEYVITDEDGKEYPGVTGEDGCTKTIYGEIGAKLTLSVVNMPDYTEGYIALGYSLMGGDEDGLA